MNRDDDEVSPGKIAVGKPTYSACLSSQETIRELLGVLIKENRALTKKERKDYFWDLPSATFGQGVTRDYSIYIEAPDGRGEFFHAGTVEQVARWLGEQTTKVVRIPDQRGTELSPEIPIGQAWSCLRDHLFHVFPFSLQMALSMSAEERIREDGDEIPVNEL